MLKVTWLVTVASGLVFAGNLLVNPGFEDWLDDSTPAGWSVENRSKTGVFRETDTVFQGRSSCQFVRRELAAGNNYGLIQRVPVQAGLWYVLSCRTWDDNPEVSIGVGVSWRKQDSTYISSSGTTYSRDSSGWVSVRDSVRAPAQAAWADFRVRTYAPSGMSQRRRCFLDEMWFGTADPDPDTVRVWFAKDSLALRLIDFIGQARYSLDYCHYNSSRADVVQAIIDAHRRGVKVRIVTDNTRLDDPWVQQVRAEGIRVWSDSIGPSPDDLMHNKFAVRDLADDDSTNDWVWVASYNPNEGELRADCALEIPHSGLARAYRLEFEQMWGGTGPDPEPANAKFHSAKKDVQPTHQFLLDGYPACVYFSPQDRPVDTIARLTAQAQRHVLFGIFAFTHDGLGDAMIGRWQDSVWVGGVIDKSGLFAQGAEYPRLVANGIPVYEDSVPFGEKIIHEKIMVIDSCTTVAGSANWSGAGNAQNDENVIVTGSPGIAQRFLAELTQRFWEATHPGIKGDKRTGFRHQPTGPTLVRSLDRLPSGVLITDVCGRVVQERKRPSPGVYYVGSAHELLEAGGSIPRRFVVVR